MIRPFTATPTGDIRNDINFQEIGRRFASGVTRVLPLTTAERDAITDWPVGSVIYNTTTSKHQGWNGTLWSDFY